MARSRCHSLRSPSSKAQLLRILCPLTRQTLRSQQNAQDHISLYCRPRHQPQTLVRKVNRPVSPASTLGISPFSSCLRLLPTLDYLSLARTRCTKRRLPKPRSRRLRLQHFISTTMSPQALPKRKASMARHQPSHKTPLPISTIPAPISAPSTARPRHHPKSERQPAIIKQLQNPRRLSRNSPLRPRQAPPSDVGNAPGNAVMRLLVICKHPITHDHGRAATARASVRPKAVGTRRNLKRTNPSLHCHRAAASTSRM